MIVLRPWTNYRAFVVVVILIADVPIEPVMQLDSEPSFRRLKTHRIRRDQRSGIGSRSGNTGPLTGVFVNSVCRKQRHPWSNTGHRFYEEEVVPHVVQAVAKWMLNAVEEIVDNGLAINPMVIVAGADREPRSRGPIE